MPAGASPRGTLKTPSTEITWGLQEIFLHASVFPKLVTGAPCYVKCHCGGEFESAVFVRHHVWSLLACASPN